MSTKEIIDEVKEGLRSDEQLMLKAFKLEKAFDKHKMKLAALAILAVVAIFGYKIKGYMDEQHLIKTNTAYNTLLENSDDTKALEILKGNEKLYKFYLFQTQSGDVQKLEPLSQGKDVLSSMMRYQIAARKGTIEALEGYVSEGSAVMANAARFNLVRLYLEKKQRGKAKLHYEAISEKSQYKALAKQMMHYGIVK